MIKAHSQCSVGFNYKVQSEWATNRVTAWQQNSVILYGQTNWCPLWGQLGSLIVFVQTVRNKNEKENKWPLSTGGGGDGEKAINEEEQCYLAELIMQRGKWWLNVRTGKWKDTLLAFSMCHNCRSATTRTTTRTTGLTGWLYRPLERLNSVNTRHHFSSDQLLLLLLLLRLQLCPPLCGTAVFSGCSAD